MNFQNNNSKWKQENYKILQKTLRTYFAFLRPALIALRKIKTKSKTSKYLSFWYWCQCWNESLPHVILPKLNPPSRWVEARRQHSRTAHSGHWNAEGWPTWTIRGEKGRKLGGCEREYFGAYYTPSRFGLLTSSIGSSESASLTRTAEPSEPMTSLLHRVAWWEEDYNESNSM